MIKDLVKQLVPSSSSRSLPSNTVANPRGDLKAVTMLSDKDGPTTVVPISTPPITPASSRIDPTLSRFTVKSLSSKLSDQRAAMTYSHMLNAAQKSVLDDSDDEEDSNIVKAITTRSGAAYEGPSTPIPPPLYDVEKEPEVAKDQVQTPSPRSTVLVQPQVVPRKKTKPGVVFDETPEFIVPKSKTHKPTIPYPSRLND